MSEISNKDIKKLSRLSKINFEDSQLDDLTSKLSGIIDWVEKLDEVDTSNVKEMINVNDTALRLEKDEVSDGGITEEVLKNAKNSKYQYFAVPKIIE